MASPSSFRGDFLRMYGAKINISSSNSQRTIIDSINLTFLVSFYLSLLLTCVTKQQRNEITPRRRSWPFLLVSISCALVSSASVGATIMALTAKDERSPHSNCVVHIVRGFIWFSLGISSLLQGSKWVRILSSLWWVSFFVLISGLNINALFSNKEMEIIDVSAWPLNHLLFLCALKDLRDLPSQHDPDNSLSQSLLNEKPEQRSGRKEGKPGFFSWLTFSWIDPLLRLGYSKPLGLDDIPPLLSEDEASLAYQRFTESWERIYKINNKSSNDNNNRHLVIKAIARVYLKEMLFTGVGALLKVLTVVASPLLLYAFIEYSKSKDENLKKGLLLLISLICIKCLESLSQRHWFFQARRTGMRIRSALMVAVYQKQLKLSSLGRKRHSVGEIVNYIAVDAYRMGEFPWWFHYCWTMFLQLFLGIGVLFFIMGMGALPGLLPLFLCCFLNVPYAKLLQKHRTHLMKAQDERLRSTSEALNNMKVIKLNAWEERFKNLVESLRVEEFKDLSALQYIRAAGTAVFWLCPTIISSIIFLGCAFLGSAPLNATTVFTVLVMLRSMSEPMRVIPESLSVLIQVKVSFDRINPFLLDDDLKHEEFIKFTSPEDTEKKFVVKIENGNFSWDFESIAQLTLRDMNLEVQKGMKIAICGPVGAGKSSLLYAILKEIPKVSGTVGVDGSIAYVAQTSWIQSGTVRENILYGKPMNQEIYQQAIRVTALDKDIHSFSHGDLTEIGQRGINLSGGQKQRIQLARAVYSDADIYLLDDPFSAVDALTAAVLFHDCVIGALAKKTVFLVTHQVEFLSGVDKILVMEEGQITQSGRYDEIMTAGTAFEQLVNAHKDSTAEEIGGEWRYCEVEGGKVQMIGVEGSNDGEISTEKESAAFSQLTEEEEKEIGDSLWKPFIDYILISRGLLSLCCSILSQTGFVIFQAMATYWLAYAVQTPSLRTVILISVYAGISTCSTIFVFFRAWFAARLGLQASKAFFSDFHQCIFRAPMLFFDSTPVGRIFTRVSSDFSILDNDISFSISLVVAPAIETIGIVAIMASVTWQVLIVVLITVVASNYVLRYYLASAREIVRINGTTKAPVMNYTAETSQGVSTIRAFKSEDRFFRRYLKLVDTDAKLFFHSNASTEWLVIRLETLQNITLFTATFFLLLLPKDISMAPGMVGLSLSYGLTFTNTQVFMSRWFCNFSNYIISVERIKQFMHIQPETPAGIMDDDEHRPPGTWPSKGRIVLRQLTVRYRPNAPLVLKGVSCTFKEESRVGVVGRTGSGKTTLISALFRLVEAESGKILIDGLDICSMGLKDLRSKLSIIPQEPTLFRGSVRSNLDPLGLYSDKEIWEALEKCQLKTTISGLPKQLESSVTEQGENWSAGERQLFCLGRVLLRKNKILVLDEATASIDCATDAILQGIIREEFRECTVITVAHRVPTVIDSDMVMVLSFGRVVEYEQPDKLLQRRSSCFAELVNEYYYSSCKQTSFGLVDKKITNSTVKT